MPFHNFMRFFKTKLLQLSILLLFTLLQSCSKPGVRVNEHIASKLKKEFHELNEVLIKALMTNNLIKLENIMSGEFIAQDGNKRLVELCNIRMKKAKCTMLDEFHIRYAAGIDSVAKSSNHGMNSYFLNYPTAMPETYIALYEVNDKKDKWLLSAIYYKYNYGWKLNEIEISQLTVQGKTAPELYQIAKAEYAKGYLVNALNTMDQSRSCSLPSVMWRYNNQEEIDRFYSKVSEEARNRYKFPVVLTQIPTKPYIIRIFNQNRDEGNFPTIYYVSKINLNDTNAVKKEHEAVKAAIGQVMPGIDKGRKDLYYTVFNGMPNWKSKNIKHFDIVDRYR